MVRYTKEKITKCISDLEQLLVLHEKQKHVLIELQTQLLRVERAMNPKCWITEKEWNKKSMKEKTKILREDKCIKFRQSDSIFQNIRDYPFVAQKQWENDRKKLIEKGEITP